MNTNTNNHNKRNNIKVPGENMQNIMFNEMMLVLGLNKDTWHNIIFDTTFYNECLYNHASISDTKRSLFKSQKILNVHELRNLLYDNLSTSCPQYNYSRSKYNNYSDKIFKISSSESDYNIIIQMILAITPMVPIILDKPKKIYWLYAIFNNESKPGLYNCTGSGCKFRMYYKNDKCIYFKNNVNEHCKKCYNAYYKQDICFYLMRLEMYKRIFAEALNMGVTIRGHYNAVLSKYRNLFSHMILNMRNFETFDNIKSSLQKCKLLIDKLTASSIQNYIDCGLYQTLEIFSLSRSVFNYWNKQILYEINEDSIILSTKLLIKILFQSDCIGGDGTFSIRPQFKIDSHRQTVHAQVFKLFAIYKYKTITNETRIKSYLAVICLLKTKYYDVYEWMYNVCLKWKNLLKISNDNCPKKYICDFEKAQRRALSQTWGQNLDMVVIGDEFHYAQAIQKKIGKLGLRTLYNIYKTKRISEEDEYKDIDSDDEYDFNEKYDTNFRIHIEKFYALTHVKKSLVPTLINGICYDLIDYTKEQKKNTQIKIMRFMFYFLTIWGGYTKEEYIELLIKTNMNRKEFNFKKASISYRINEWNVNGEKIRTNNAIEVNNRHHCSELGHAPTINKFMHWWLINVDNTLRDFNWDYHKTDHRTSYMSTYLKNKNALLQNYICYNWTYELFCGFSIDLSKIRYTGKHDRWQLIESITKTGSKNNKGRNKEKRKKNKKKEKNNRNNNNIMHNIDDNDLSDATYEMEKAMSIDIDNEYNTYMDTNTDNNDDVDLDLDLDVDYKDESDDVEMENEMDNEKENTNVFDSNMPILSDNEDEMQNIVSHNINDIISKKITIEITRKSKRTTVTDINRNRAKGIKVYRTEMHSDSDDYSE